MSKKNTKLTESEYKTLKAKIKEQTSTAAKSQGRLEQLLENAKKMYGYNTVSELKEKAEMIRESIKKKAARRLVVQEKIIAAVPKEIIESCQE